MTNRLMTWAAFIAALIVWNMFSPQISSSMYTGLGAIGVPPAVTSLILMLLPLILMLEVVAKALMLRSLAPLTVMPTQVDDWPHVDKDQITRYTAELERLGFVHLIDYTHPGLKGMGRLFAHPEHFFFAEVGQLQNVPMFCSLVCPLEQQWSLSVTNLCPPPMLAATMYAFLRQPRALYKRFENTSTHLLLLSLMDWQDQVSKYMALQPLQDIQAETYFEGLNAHRAAQRKVLMHRSMTWAQLEMLWFLIHPKSQWLGASAKSVPTQDRLS